MFSRKILTRLFIFIILTILVGGLLIPTHAAPIPPYTTPDYPPRPPGDVLSKIQPLAESLSQLNLPPLKAVLLVGNIDGNEGEWTLSEIANMELAANVLEANGVSVQRFYPGVGTFADIESAVEDAQFLLYRGHGVYDGNLPSPNVGGFALSSGYYSPDLIRNNLHLAPNAIVMLYACFSAGSSSADGDNYDIGIVEASRRVAQYSDPFFDAGASGYYANWYGDAFAHFLSNLFAGKTLGNAYESYFDFDAKTVFRTSHPDHPGLSMWIDKDNWNYWQYNNAFVGKHDQTLVDLFKPATLGGIPSSLDFVVDVSENFSVQPPSYIVSPRNVSGNIPIEWSLNSSDGWYEVSPLQGETPNSSFSVIPTTFDTTKPGKYTGNITVSATSPLDTQNPIQSIIVNMNVLAPELGGLPNDIVFYFSIPDQEFMIDRFVLSPQNSGSSLPLELLINSDSNWINISPNISFTGQQFIITAEGFNTMTVAKYTGTITVTATTPSSIPVYQSPKAIHFSLYVSDRPIYRIYLPWVNR